MVVHVGDDGLPVYEVLDTWLTYCQTLRLKRCDMAAPSEASPETVRHAAPEALAAMPETETQAETMPRPVIKRPLWRVPDTMPETVSPAKAPKRLLEKAPSSPTAWQDTIPATEDEIAASLERVKKEVALREIARNEGVAYEESGAEDAPGSPGLDTLFAGYRTAWSGDVAGTGSGADTNAVAANVEEAGVEENENCEEGGCDESNIDLAPLGGAMEVHVHEIKMDKEVTPKYRSTTGHRHLRLPPAQMHIKLMQLGKKPRWKLMPCFLKLAVYSSTMITSCGAHRFLDSMADILCPLSEP